MGAGIFVVVVGALLVFAVEDHVPNLNLTAAGIILMIAGGVVIWHSRVKEKVERTVTHVEESSDPNEATHTETETVREQHPTD